MKEVFSIPLVTTYHGQVPRGVNKLAEEKLRMVLDKGDAFIVNTGYAKNELIAIGCNDGKIHVIPQGTILNDFSFHARSIVPGHKIILLTVGRLSIEKGHQVAISAVKHLSETFPNLEYHIVGNGSTRDDLITQTNRCGLQNRVIFHGFRTVDELQVILKSAHIFVLPSINTGDGYHVETQGVVLQEAQACGIPVIGSRTGGIPEVIRDNETGLLYDENNSHDLATKLERLIVDPELYHKLSVSGRIDVEKHFDINIVSTQLLSLYREILDH